MKHFKLRIILVTILVFVVTACAPQAADNDTLPTAVVLPSLTPSQPAAVEPTLLPTETAAPTELPTETATTAPTETAEVILTDTPQAVSVAATIPPTAGPVNVQPPGAAVPNQVVITFTAGTSAADRAAYIERIGGRTARSVNIGGQETVIIEVAAGIDETTLPPSPVVAASEPDYYLTAQVLTNEPDDPYFPGQWGLQMIGIPAAWLRLPANMQMVSVAVIDSGICADHPDLQGRILPGWDFVENDSSPQDDFGHGCGVASIIAANTNNAMGIAGAAPNAQIIPLRVLDRNGIGRYSDVAAAIVWAVDNGAHIINLSLGGGSPSLMLQNAVDYATSQGVIVVAAAGNTGSAAILYPAAYPNVIAVGSVDEDGSYSSFSSTHSSIDLWAPGRSIRTYSSAQSNDDRMTGTSFAAPHVSAVAALEIALGGSLNLNGAVVAIGAGAPPVSTPESTAVVAVPTATVEVATSAPAVELSIDFDYIESQSVPHEYRTSITMLLRNRLQAANMLDDYHNFVVTAYRSYENWAEVMLLPIVVLEDNWNNFTDDLLFEVIVYDPVDGAVQAVVKGSAEFEQVADMIPQNLLDLSTDYSNALSTGFKFPWAAGAAWWHIQGWHGTGSLYQDFQPYPGDSHEVLAANTGTFSVICQDPYQSMVRVAGSAGTTNYLHLASGSIPGQYSGQTVPQGLVIGSLYGGTAHVNGVCPPAPYRYNTACGCGYSAHLHFGFPSANTIIDGNNANTIASTASCCSNPPRRTSTNTRLTNINNPPGVPTITAPAQNAVVGNPFTATWQQGALNHTGLRDTHIQVSRTSNFSDLVSDQWSVNLTYNITVPGPGTYYMRIRQCDRVALCSAWTATRTFTVGLQAPSNLAAVPDGRQVINLTWRDNSTQETQFRIERRPVGGAWAQIATVPANTTTYVDSAGLVCGTRYEYRVRAAGSGSLISNYSNTVGVTAECNPPRQAPRIVAPVNNSFLNTTSPALEWQEVPNATRYRVQVALDARFRDIVREYDVAQTSLNVVPALANNRYFWRVMGYNSIGNGRWANARFTVDTIAPAVPQRTTPLHDSRTDNQRPTFRWDAVRDEASNPVTYQVRLGTTNPPTAVYDSRRNNFRPATPLLVGRTYYWQVRTIDRAGNASAWSSVWSVFIDANSRAVPLRWRYTTPTPTLRWTRISWATAYEIQVDDDQRFRTPEFHRANIANPSSGHPSVMTTNLPAGIYYWRVRARRADGTWSAWSAADSFYIE